MSEANVEIVRAAIENYNRGDWDSALRDMAPEFEFDLSRGNGPNRGVYRLDRVRGVLDDLAEIFSSARIDPDDFIEAGDDVIVPWTFRAAGRDGIKVQARTAWVFTIRDGAIERATMYQERKEALEAAGLSE